MQTLTSPGTAPEGGPSYFRSKRIFYHAALAGGDAGWCFAVRGGHVYGPFESPTVAERILAGLIEKFKRTGNTGGR